MRTLFQALRYDLQYALRGLRRRPGFTLAVVAIFALGIGANSTMFGIIDRLLLRAPPYVVDPDRVLLVHTKSSRLPDDVQTTQAYSLYNALWAGVEGFADVAVATPTSVVQRTYYPLGRGPSATRVAGALVSASYFSVLGVRPALGRFFLPDEEQESSPQKLAVIGYAFWQRHFAGRLDAVGQSIEVGTARYTIIGVAPAGFTGVEPRDVDLWLPVTAAEGLRFARSPD